jgi:tRNA-binding protein
MAVGQGQASRQACPWPTGRCTIRPALASIDDFLALDVRVGTITSAEVLKGARRPAFALQVDFGALGVRRSSAQISDLYEPADLVGLQVVAVTNFPSKRVAGFESEVLVLAVDNGKGEQVLLIPERPVPDGGKVS